MNARQKSSGWADGALRLLINNADKTKPYTFETGDTERVIPRDLNALAQSVAKANSAVELARAVLEDSREHEKQVNQVARNEVVNCEGELLKAEIAADNANKLFWKQARERMGLSDGEPE